jgi:hypothetical protein
MTVTHTPVEDNILSICDQVDKAIADLEANKMIDAVEIEKTAQNLCMVLEKLPAAQAKSYLPKLSALIKYLDGVSQKLEQQKEIVRQDLSGLQDRGAAFSAYQNASRLRGDK